MAEETLPFLDEEEEAAEEGMMEEGEESPEGPDVEVDVDIEEKIDYASPTEALSAAIKEHGADPEKLIAWFEEFGYELKKVGDDMGMEGMGMEEGPMIMDLASMRNSAASKAMEGM